MYRLHINSVIAVLAVLSLVLTSEWTQAKQPVADSTIGSSVPCAVLKQFRGKLQILDGPRENVVLVAPKSAIPCGSSISVDGSGWGKLLHREGFEITLGGESFGQITDSRSGDGSALLLFRGKAFIEVPSGTAKDFQGITAGTRVKSHSGRLLLEHDTNSEETQLVVLEGKARIANRHLDEAFAELKPGEASSINISLLRTAPTAPLAVSQASLKSALSGFDLDAGVEKQILTAASHRSERKFASVWKSPAPSRAPASLGSQPVDEKSLPKEPRSSGVPHNHMVKRLVGGAPGGEDLLNQKTHSTQQRHARVQVDGREDVLTNSKSSDERARDAAEKKRLMEELSRIGAE